MLVMSMNFPSIGSARRIATGNRTALPLARVPVRRAVPTPHGPVAAGARIRLPAAQVRRCRLLLLAYMHMIRFCFVQYTV